MVDMPGWRRVRHHLPSRPGRDGAAALAGTTNARPEALDAVIGVAHGGGLLDGGAGIFRSGSAVIVGLPEARVLGRVDAPGREESARRQVIVSELLAEVGVAAVSVSDPYDQPVVTEAGARHDVAVAERRGG